MEYISKPREVTNPYYKGVCAYCGKEFFANKSFAKYCSSLCRLKAQREREKEKSTEKKEKKVAQVQTKKIVKKEQRKEFETTEQLREFAIKENLIKNKKDLVIRGKFKKIPNGLRVEEKGNYRNGRKLILYYF